ncbi:MAG TPA: alpha/beta fold hydrolase [Streptosporangiaceae bacterium]|nr:alpha/beta fold hydrolase [Streptosporangiaceae bacterium]
MPASDGAAEWIGLVTVNGRTLRVAVRGLISTPDRRGAPEAAGAPPPLLLCNGIGGSLEQLAPFADALGRGREVIRFDLPGIGGSPPPAVPYHLTTLPGLLRGLLDRLGHPKADVLGISWGGGLAQQLALAHPRLVRRLVLVATGTGTLMVPAHPRVLRHMLTPQRHRDPGYAAAVAAQIYGGSLRTDPDRARELLHAGRQLGPRRGYYYQLLAGVGWTSLPLLPLLRPPTLLLAGDDDPVIPLANARLMHRLIPHSELHVYHGGHLELIAQPGRLAPVVEAFLDARPAPSTAPDRSQPGRSQPGRTES